MSSIRQVERLNLEKNAKLSRHFLSNTLDKSKGYLPFFWIFISKGKEKFVELRHSWPDQEIAFRYLDSLIKLNRMKCNKESKTAEEKLKKLLLSCLKEDGLAYRPEWPPMTSYDAPIMDQNRALTALVSWFEKEGSKFIKDLIDKMIEKLTDITFKKRDYWYFPYNIYTPSGWNKEWSSYWGEGEKKRQVLTSVEFAISGAAPNGGMLILPLVEYYRLTKNEKSLKLAKMMVNWNLYHSEFKEDGSFVGHFHSHSNTILGILLYGFLTNKRDLIDWGIRAYNWAKERLGTDFGWFPEREHKNVCETCCIVDMVEIAITLAQNGYPEYWADAERFVRNQLIENQLKDTGWLKEGSNRDTEFSIFKNVPEKIKGAFAGWSYPTDFYAEANSYRKNMDFFVMNCCSGHAPRAIYSAWENSVKKDNRGIWVNFLWDKRSKWVEVKGYQPYQGKVEIKMFINSNLFIRIPDWVKGKTLKIKVDGKYLHSFFSYEHKRDIEWAGEHIIVNNLKKGQKVIIEFPLRLKKERVFAGEREYEVQWRGDTVIKIKDITGRKANLPLYQRFDF